MVDAKDGGHPASAADLSVAPRSSHRLRRWIAGVVGLIVIVPAVIFGLWAALTLAYTYSAGNRAGYVQKFSQKGWVCKTWEGELSMVTIPGATQERWQFTVRDDSVAVEVLRSIGRRVTLEYREHRGVPTSCFG